MDQVMTVEDKEGERLQGQLDMFFTVIFILEFIITLTAVGARAYFTDQWHQLDFVVVCEGVYR